MTRIKAIISDADGTLVNTVYLIRHGQYEAGVTYLVEAGAIRIVDDLASLPNIIEAHNNGSQRLF